jgi:large conductance mechanosensitive channel
MLKGLRDFLLRGNLIDLAVAFVVGAAFTAVVMSLVDNVLMPVIGKMGGEPNFDSVDVADIPIGAFITDLVAFVLIATAVYFLVVAPYNRLLEMRKRGEVEESEVVEENTLLLREIRDALRAKSSEESKTP